MAGAHLRRGGRRATKARSGFIRSTIAMLGPTLMAYRHRRAEARARAAIALGRGRVVPALQRTRRGLRPRQPRVPSGARRRRLRRHRAEGVELRRAVVRPRHPPRPDQPRRAQAPRHHVPARRHGELRASRCGRSSRRRAPRTSTRCSSRTCASRLPTCSARSTAAGRAARTVMANESAMIGGSGSSTLHRPCCCWRVHFEQDRRPRDPRNASPTSTRASGLSVCWPTASWTAVRQRERPPVDPRSSSCSSR